MQPDPVRLEVFLYRKVSDAEGQRRFLFTVIPTIVREKLVVCFKADVN